MTWDHERVQEFLAARALNGLDPEEAALAERALLEHVPGCQDCRDVLDGFARVAGDLALLADPRTPPETLRARIGRTASRRRRLRLRGAGWSAAAVAAVVTLGLAGWNMALTSRLSDAEETQGWLTQAVLSSAHPEGSVVPLTGPGPERASMVYVHGEDAMYVIAGRLPQPSGAYVVWLRRPDRTWSPGRLEMHDGVAFLFVRTDPDRWDVIMITDEADEGVPAPTSSPLVSASVE